MVAPRAFELVNENKALMVIPQPALEKPKSTPRQPQVLGISEVIHLPAPEINHSRQDFQGVEARQQELEKTIDSQDAWLKQVQADALLSYTFRREAVANDDGIFWN